MRRARLILNPIPWARRAWSQLPEMMAVFDQAEIRADLTFTKMTEAMTRSVRRAADEGYDLVVAGGGDGTVSEVAAGLVGTEVPLGILPFGTFNNIAHSLGLPLDLVQAAQVIAEGRVRSIDVGLANDTYFFEAAGMGLDASLLPIGEEIKGGHYEKLLEGAVTLLGHQRVGFRLKVDGAEMNLNCPMIVVANGPYYGAGFTVAPQANLEDGLLDIVTFDCSRMEIARHFALSARNREHQEVCIMSFRAREVQITPEIELPAHADGKPLGNMSLTCRVLSRSLKVVAP